MKKQNNKAKQNVNEPTKPVTPALQLAPKAFYERFYFQAIVLAIIGFAFYYNSFYNEYALDDGIVIKQNEYVQKGLKGIPEIMKTDAYDSFYKQMGSKQQLAGGRYRPLSPVTFAIEQEFFGSKEKEPPLDDVAFIRHAVNVVLYVLSIVILLYFLHTYVFPNNPFVAFAASLVFLIHPLHTEVVANVKSRDEILSMLFIVLTFIQVFRYRESKKPRILVSGLVFYFLSLLSKEYAITLFILLPMFLIILKGDTLKGSVMSVIPYYLVGLLYLYIRFRIVGKGATFENPDVLNNPYMFATKPEKLATKIEMLNHYLRLLFYPYPLSSDYSYSTIPYTNFKSPLVWFSIFFNISLIVGTFMLYVRKKVLALALAFYLVYLFMICNLIMDIGATMGERLIYHSSLGFAIALAMGIHWVFSKIKMPVIRNGLLAAMGIVVTVWCGNVVIARNAQWKNDTSLFIHDSNVVPNSVLVNGNAGQAYIKLSDAPENKGRQKEMLDSAIVHLTRALSVHKRYVNGYLNLGVAYYQLKDYEKAKEQWDIAQTIYPNNPYLTKYYGALGSIYFNEAVARKNEPTVALQLLEKCVAVVPGYVDGWYNLGGAYFTLGNYAKARECWERALQLDPKNENALKGMAALPAGK